MIALIKPNSSSKLVRLLPVVLATAGIGGILSFSIAYLYVGTGVSFWPYFSDGAIFGLFLGTALLIFRSYAQMAISGAIFLTIFGCFYFYFLIGLLGV